MATEDRVLPGSTSAASLKFGDMSVAQKSVFVGKFIVFLCSFGFAFPTLLND